MRSIIGARSPTARRRSRAAPRARSPGAAAHLGLRQRLELALGAHGVPAPGGESQEASSPPSTAADAGLRLIIALVSTRAVLLATSTRSTTRWRASVR
jgi:hypothetical protein